MTQVQGEWYVIVADGTRQGPQGRAALLAMYAAGTIQGNALVWTVGMQGWQPLAEVFKDSLPPSVPSTNGGKQEAWFYLDANGRQRPITRKSLLELPAAGKVTGAPRVWTAGMTEWQPFSVAFPDQTKPFVAQSPIGARSRKPTGCLTWVVLAFVALLLLAIILPAYNDYASRAKAVSASSSSSPVPAKDAKSGAGTPLSSADPKSRIADDIFKADDKSQYPKLAKTLGKSWSRLQPAREAAALHVAASPKCDYVEIVEAAERSTENEIVFFVDCRNGERMYVSESDLKKGATPAFQSQKTIDQGTAVTACRDAARKMATFPESVDVHVFTGTAFSTNKTTGNARLAMDFDAKNAFGAKIGYRATCIFPADGIRPEITVEVR